MRLRKLRVSVGSSLWFVPVICVLAGAALSFGTIALDRAFGYEAIPQELVGGPDAATAILSTVAASMVSLTTLVLTITMVVVQLAMGQFSPRIVQRILRDKPSQLAIGLFVATFVHACSRIREVVDRRRWDGHGAGHRGRDRVPARAREHRRAGHLRPSHRPVASRLRPDRAGRQRHAAAHRPPCTPTRAPVPARPERPACGGSRGSPASSRDRHRALVAEAARAACALELVPPLGEFVPAGAPLFLSTAIRAGWTRIVCTRR